MQKIGILGYGEVGKAIARFYKNPKIKDLNRNDGLKGIDILHICIPWGNSFVDVSVQTIKEFKPKLAIIHSTIAPGTTKKIIKRLPNNLKSVAHSPVRGVHPYLYKGIKTFIKYIGAEDKKTGNKIKNHFKDLGLESKVFLPAISTELGKLFDTTYYGLLIAWHGEMARICRHFGVNFDEAVTDFNKSYNEGYVKLGKNNVVRSVLYPPQDKIGGHCIIPNVEILKKYIKSSAFEIILEYKKNKNK